MDPSPPRILYWIPTGIFLWLLSKRYSQMLLVSVMLIRRGLPFWYRRHSIDIMLKLACPFFPPANKVCSKVIFLHLFVILFTGGVCLSACWDTSPPWEQTPPPPRTRHPPWSRPPPGADSPPTPTPGAPGAEHTGRYGQQAGGTHPTGMQSCLGYKLWSEQGRVEDFSKGCADPICQTLWS